MELIYLMYMLLNGFVMIIINNLKPIPNCSDYHADTEGNIWSNKLTSMRKLTRSPNCKSNYLTVYFVIDAGNQRKYVHRLILETFVGPCPKGMVACHNNGKRDDNRLENLRWDTISNNHLDKVKHGTSNRGEKHFNSKLTKSQVKIIKHLLLFKTLTHQEISKFFDVTRMAITDINLGNNWYYI